MNELARLSVDQRDEMDNDALRSLLESEAANLRVQQLRLEVASTKRAARWAELESEQHIATRAMESVFDGFSAQVVDHMQRYLERREFHGRGLNGGWPTDPEDTKDGHFKPFWQTLAEYRELMGIIRDLVQIHEQCETITQKIVDYVVHTGFTHKIEPVDLDEDEELVKAAQKILDEFHDRTNWIVEREGNFVGETIQYGEQLVWLRHDGDGKTTLVDVPLEQISEPLPRYHGQLEEIYDLPAASWTYGVVTEAADTTKILGFFWDRDHTGANYDFIPAAEAMWIKVNTPDQVKRGRTDFYPLLEMFGITKPIIRNVGWQTAIQASIAYIRKQTIGSTGGGHITPLGPSGAPITRRTRGGENLMGEVHRPGSIHDTNGVEYEAGPMGNNQADSYVAVYEAILRIMGQRWEMPEFLISGVADTANKSTTEDSVEPWYRRVERTQVFFAHHFQRADRRVLSIAIEAGRLAEFGISSIEEFDERLTLAVKGAPTKRSRPEDEIDGDVALVEAKVMSRQTLREKHNLNHEREERRIEQEMQQDLQRQEQHMDLQQRMNPQEPGEGQPPGHRGAKGNREQPAKEEATTPNTPAIELPSVIEERHDYATVQIDLPAVVARQVLALAATIDGNDLSEDGRETQPHITVKYGLTDDAPADKLRALLSDQPAFDVTLGPTAMFSNDADVVYVSVESYDLRELHERIGAAMANEDQHPAYTPHVTLGYLKSGRGAQHVGSDQLDGVTFRVESLSVRDRDGGSQTIYLEELGDAPAEDEPEPASLTEAAALIWADYPGGKPGE